MSKQQYDEEERARQLNIDVDDEDEDTTYHKHVQRGNSHFTWPVSSDSRLVKSHLVE